MGALGSGPLPGHADPAPEAPEATWHGAIDRVLAGLAAAGRARLRVLRIEARQAVRASIAAAAMAAGALLMIVTAWFALLGAIVSWAVLAGYQWPWVLLCVMVACLGLAGLGFACARAWLSAINFDATARVLQRGQSRSVHATRGAP